MEQAAESQDYERAASLRDRLAPLEWLANRLERLRQRITLPNHDGPSPRLFPRSI